jgi:hemolysin type calcium-binding protein
MRSVPASKSLGATFAVALALLVVPSTSLGATTSVVGGVLRYTATAGEANNVTIAPNAGGLTHRVTDSGANVSPGIFCFAVSGDSHSVDCGDIGVLVTSMAVDLGDKDDYVTLNEALPSTIAGGAGNDTLVGGTGTDTVHGGAGADTIAVRDNVLDQVDCGSETDNVVADTLDSVAADCESVQRAIDTGSGLGGGIGGGGSGGSGGGGSSPGTSAPGVAVTTGNASLSPSGDFSLNLACRGAARCRGTLVAYTVKKIATSAKKKASKQKAKRVRLAKRRVSIRGGKTQSLKFKLSKKLRRVFQRLHMTRVRARITVYYTTTAGLKGSAQRTVTLVLPRR